MPRPAVPSSARAVSGARRPHGLHGLGCLLPALTALLLLAVCRLSPAYAEYVHARIVFPGLSTAIAWITSQYAVSLTELAAVLGLPLLLLLLILAVRAVRRSPCRRRCVGRIARGCGWFLSTLFLLYMLLHGLLFYRYSVSTLLDLDTGVKSPAYLRAVCLDLARRANDLREGLGEDDNGVMTLRGGVPDALFHVSQYIRDAKRQYPFLKAYDAQPKGVLLSHLWSYTGVTGFYSMPLAEANVNIDVPACSLPFTLCHELSHTYGFAREDEANFWGYLLCRDSTSTEFQYSGNLMAFVYCSNALYALDRTAWLAVWEELSSPVRRDLAAQNAYWNGFQGKVMQAASSINDGFLKMQSQEDGILSYDRVVDLILAQYEKDGFVLRD